MTEFEALAQQISLRMDIIGMFLCASMFAGVMACLVIGLKWKKGQTFMGLLCGLILSLSLIQTELFLAHTGLMVRMIWVRHATDFLVMSVPALIYLLVVNLLKWDQFRWKKDIIHFLPGIFYGLLQIAFHIQPPFIKLISYTNTNHPELGYRDFPPDAILAVYFSISQYFMHATILLAFIYTFLIIKKLRAYNFYMKRLFGQEKHVGKISFSQYILIFFLIISLLYTVVAIIFDNDTGNVYLAMILALFLLGLNFVLMAESKVFDPAWILDKYHTSGLGIGKERILQKVKDFVERENYSLQKEASLKDLASHLSISPNHLSQVINEHEGKNFNDFINAYRIEAAKSRLTDPAYAHLTIAGIGETVGFNSKSAFYAAFKKHTQMTPTAYQKSGNSAQ